MARDGALPRGVARVSGRTGATWVALLANAAALVAVALTGSVALAASVGGVLYVLHFLGPLAALAVLRRRDEDGAAPAFSVPLARVVLPLAFAACAALLAGAVLVA
jgi:APA family basic amino acid/polyamine antiporter